MRKVSLLLLAGAVLLVSGLISVETVMRYRDVVRYNDSLGTAFVSGQTHAPRRSLFFATDAYLWNKLAFEFANGTSFRVRRTDFDNHPYGREVHWSAGYLWLLAGAGRLWQFASGLDLATAVERASLVLNPALLVFLVTVSAAVTWRRLHNPAAAAVVLSLGASPAALDAFAAAKPDHHGLAFAATFLALLLLLLAGGGYVRSPDPGHAPREGGLYPLLTEREARKWFIASALCAAAGMWISAFSIAAVIASVGLGSFLQLTVFRPRDGYAPGLWRCWGTVGAAASVSFYLLEYFPSHMGMRLEVNHPLYAMAWWGGAHILAWYGDWRMGQQTGVGANRPKLAIAVAALLLLPAALWWGGSRFYAPFDPMLWRWHQGISEFWPLQPMVLLWSFPAMVLIWVATLVRAAWKGASHVERGLALLVASSALLPLSLTLWQGRWAMFLGAVLATVPAAATIFCRRAKEPLGLNSRRWGAFVLVALMAQGLFVWQGPIREMLEVRPHGVSVTIASNAAAYEAAQYLRQAEGDRELVLLSSSWLSVAMSYVANARGISSMYWENLAGFRAMADIFTATSEEEALRLIRERGITHIVAITSGYNPSSTHYYKFGSVDREAVDRSFEANLSAGRTRPWWLTPMPYASREPFVQSNPRFYRVTIFRVNPLVLKQAT